jgi:hypothetical protein
MRFLPSGRGEELGILKKTSHADEGGCLDLLAPRAS